MTYTNDPNFWASVKSVLGDVMGLPDTFLDYMVQHQALNGLPVPISQITGFTQFTPQSATAADRDTTSAGAYGDLSVSTGPTLSNLGDGTWLFVYGAEIATSVAANTASMAIQVNSTGASDDDYCHNEGTNFVSCMAASLKTLDNGGSSTVTCKYKTGGGALGTFGRRFLIGLKVANI